MENLAAIHIMVFVHKTLYTEVNYIGSSAIKTGFYNLMGNKGAVAVWFKYKKVSFIFINCHLSGKICNLT